MRIRKLLLKDGDSTQILSAETNKYSLGELLYYADEGLLFLCDMMPANGHHIESFLN